MINGRNSESGGWSLAGDRGDSEQVVGDHWQKTEETMTMVGWPLAGDRGDSEKSGGWSLAGDRGDSEQVVGWSQAEDRGDNDNGGVATGKRQRRQ